MPTQRRIAGLGYIADLPDFRDHLSPVHLPTSLPTRIDLRRGCPPPYDQGELGSCTANAIAAAIQFDEMKAGRSSAALSRLFIYYNERAIEGTVDTDAGASLRDGIKTVASTGVCPETEWPYVVEKFAIEPTPRCYGDAVVHRAITYARVPQVLYQLQATLAGGLPFVFGFSVYDSFESQAVTTTGQVPMPGPRESLLGGHAVMAVGYDSGTQTFLVRNSWGSGWGMGGYFMLPFAYLTTRGLSSDHWVIQQAL